MRLIKRFGIPLEKDERSVVTRQTVDKGEVGCERPPSWRVTQAADTVVVDELVVGSLMSSYGDDSDV